MVSDKQLIGMQGVYLVAAELSRLGFITSLTSRSARGADILVTDSECKKAFSIQVKTNAGESEYWLLNEHSKEMVSDSHIYVFVAIEKLGVKSEFFIVPSRFVADKMFVEKYGKDIWYSFTYKDAISFKNNWNLLKGK